MSNLETSELPPWRAALLAIPPSRRSQSQRDLIRGLELADLIEKELENPLPTSITSDRTTNLLLYGIEVYLLGPFSFSAFELKEEAIVEKFRSWVFDMTKSNFFDRCIVLSVDSREALPFPNTLLFIMLLLIYTASPPDTHRIPRLFDVALELFKLLDWDLVDRTIAESGSGLCTATLQEAIVYLRPSFIIDDSTFDDVKMTLLEVLNALDSATLKPWQIIALYEDMRYLCMPFDILEVPDVLFGVPLKSEAGFVVIEQLRAVTMEFSLAMERARAAAEADGDDVALALSAGYLARLMMLGVTNEMGQRIKELAEKANAALAAARPYLPKTHRILLNAEDIVQNMGDPSEDDCICNAAMQLILGFDAIKMQENGITTISTYNSAPVRTCGNCGAKSKELLACSVCVSRWYCGYNCQKLHWKAGHKAECAALKAKAEEEKAAAAEEAAAEAMLAEAAAKAAAAAQAAPSSSVPKSLNSEKKSKKKKGKKK